MKTYIENTGVKQKAIAYKAGLVESKLSLSLQGKRKLEAGEYASICNALGVPMNKFLKPRLVDVKGAWKIERTLRRGRKSYRTIKQK